MLSTLTLQPSRLNLLIYYLVAWSLSDLIATDSIVGMQFFFFYHVSTFKSKIECATFIVQFIYQNLLACLYIEVQRRFPRSKVTCEIRTELNLGVCVWLLFDGLDENVFEPIGLEFPKNWTKLIR